MNMLYSKPIPKTRQHRLLVTLGILPALLAAGSAQAIDLLSSNDVYEVKQSAPLTVNYYGGVLNNDHSDIANDPALSITDVKTAELVSGPMHGTLAFESDGSFVYTPDLNFTGTDSFVYFAEGKANVRTKATGELVTHTLTGANATVSLNVNAGVSLPAVFTSHMVLQRGKPVPVWGWSSPNDAITVTMSSGESASTTADASGTWSVTLPVLTTGGPYTLTVDGGSSQLVLADILVGDVWMAVGQSNMGFKAGVCDGWENEEELVANYPNYRHIRTARGTHLSPQQDFTSERNPHKADGWEACTPEVAAKWSAVCYYFGKEIHVINTNIPIGVIQTAYAGTEIETWLPEAYDPWDIDPQGLQMTTGKFNTMVNPYIPMALSGFIYYQGEANRLDALYWVDKKTKLITRYRELFGQGDLPFYSVQIAPFDDVNKDYTEPLDTYPKFWEAQTHIMDQVPLAGMAVCTDLPADITELHPKQKKEIGQRLGLWAKKDVYGQANIVHEGPMFSHITVESGQIRVHYETASIGGGLVSRDGQALTWFEIAGADEVYVTNANAIIDGNTVVVSSPLVANPEHVRFAWHSHAQPNLMNVEELTANTFRDNPPPLPAIPAIPFYKAAFNDTTLGAEWDVVSGDVTGRTIGGNPDGCIRMRGVSTAILHLDTTGYENIDLQYDRNTANFDEGEELTVEWSAGGAWTTIEITAQTNYATISIALPVAADNYADLQIRLTSSANKVSEHVYLDNVIVWADKITTGPINTNPAFSSNPVVEVDATENSAYSSSIADNASDADSDPLTFSSISGPSWLTVAANGDLSGTPALTDVGINNWTVQVSDGNGGTDTTTLNISVAAASGGETVTLFSDGFENGVQLDSLYSPWVITDNKCEYASQGAVSGSFGTRMKNGASCHISVSTVGYSAIEVGYTRQTASLSGSENLTIDWSVDGANWTVLEVTQETAWATKTFALPTAADEQANLRIRFTVNSNKNTEQARMDDVLITGVN